MDKPEIKLDYDLATKTLAIMVEYAITALVSDDAKKKVWQVVEDFIDAGVRSGVNEYIRSLEPVREDLIDQVVSDLRAAGITVVPIDLGPCGDV